MEIFKTWTTADLVGFARPQVGGGGMPMDIYRKLRREKDEEYKRRTAPRLIWKTSPPLSVISAAMEKFEKDPDAFKNIWHDCLGTYRRRPRQLKVIQEPEGI